jgi:hypothetical protein
MGNGFSINAVGVAIAPPVVRPSPDTTTHAVPTELPAPRAATQPPGTAAAANNPQAPQRQLTQNVVVDSPANTIVYQTINQQTGQVISQFPDDAVLQARAYYHALDELTLEKGLFDETA